MGQDARTNRGIHASTVGEDADRELGEPGPPSVHIVHVVENLPRIGGGQACLVTMALAARRQGFGVSVVLYDPLDPTSWYGRQLTSAGVPVLAPPRWLRAAISGLSAAAAWLAGSALCLPIGIARSQPLAVSRMRIRQATHFGLYWRTMDAVLQRHLSRSVLQARGTLVHAHLPSRASQIVVRWAAERGTPCVYHDHGEFGKERLVQYTSNYSGSDLLRLSTDVTWVVFSDAIADRVRSFLGAGVRVVVLPNWCPDAVANSVPRPPHTEAPCVVGALGRLTEDKGFDTLVRAIGRLKNAGRAVRCVIGGAGPYGGHLQRLIDELRLQEEVVLSGEVWQDDVASFLAGLDVFSLPSASEGMPVAILEAMAAGLPVVATRVGAIPEMVQDRGSGLLVPVGDVVRLAEAIATLADDAGLRKTMGNAGRRAYAANYSEAVVWPRLERVYTEALAASASCD